MRNKSLTINFHLEVLKRENCAVGWDRFVSFVMIVSHQTFAENICYFDCGIQQTELNLQALTRNLLVLRSATHSLYSR